MKAFVFQMLRLGAFFPDFFEDGVLCSNVMVDWMVWIVMVARATECHHANGTQVQEPMLRRKTPACNLL